MSDVDRIKRELKCLEQKRLDVLKEIKPICEAFGISDYDYIIVHDYTLQEILRIEKVKIACSCNSIYAVKQELVGYIFINYFKERALGRFKTQVFNQITAYWLLNGDEIC